MTSLISTSASIQRFHSKGILISKQICLHSSLRNSVFQRSFHHPTKSILPLMNKQSNYSSLSRISMIERHISHSGSKSAGMSLSNQPLVLAKTDANFRSLTLNRPKALNALNHEMIDLISNEIVKWERSDEAKIVILKGIGRAFCAGGDVVSVVSLAESNVQEKQKLAASFFQSEYQLDSFIAKMSTPVVCFLDGITMGGGLGLSIHTPFRIATENTRVAMPETTIGLFPDVGATFFLPRLDGELGTYLGLTSTNLYGWAAYQAGFASHYVPSASLPALEERLSALSPTATHDRINDAINEFSADVIDGNSSNPTYELTGFHRQAIDHCFGRDTVEEIVGELEAIERGHLFFEHPSLREWAQKTRETILNRSPTSCKLTLMALREGRKLSIDECFLMEMRLAATCCDFNVHQDFVIGTRHLLVEKKKTRANWNPESLEEVDPHILQRLFFSSKPEPTTHVLPLKFIETQVRSYKSYPHANFSLPSEEIIKQHVIGSVKGSGDFAVTKRELIDIIQRKYQDKVGVKEKVKEVLSRRAIEKGEKEGNVLKWRY
ncbi:hypothetical protein O181_022770 [Austropuccinia psidii MF-1]|uniref:3-hydroxyisobutyryl-CoA hydrolase n=1 Tax=Austropuccinia psidii MF-1 TaxID=1389203 RepID=A0A9Q3GYF2_9BASI|nr:hypothetical protein [Austropuccinia psidii MF-1]